MRFVSLTLLLLLGCSTMGPWTLIGDSPTGKMFMKNGSLAVDGHVVTVFVRQEYSHPLSTTFSQADHWAVNQLVRIRCDEATWTTLTVEAFDNDGKVLKDGTFDGTAYYPIPEWASVRRAANAICANAIEGAPIAVQSLE
jgi:hypothetical protein